MENNKAYSSIFSDILPSDSISILENENIQEKKVNYFAKHNAFHSSALNFNSQGKIILPEILEIPGITLANGHLRRLENLTVDQKEKAIKIIIRNSHETTLASLK